MKKILAPKEKSLYSAEVRGEIKRKQEKINGVRDINELRKLFRSMKGIDNSSLHNFYVLNPHHKVEIMLSWLNPVLVIFQLLVMKIPYKLQELHFNKTELNRLVCTSKRLKFDFIWCIMSFIKTILGFGANMVNVDYWLVNFVSFWSIVVLEFYFPHLTYQIWYIVWVYTIFAYQNIHTIHLYYKSHGKINLEKLKNRSHLIEERIGAVVGNYLRANFLYVLLLKAFVNMQWITVSGTNLQNLKSWLYLWIDNMITVGTIATILARSKMQIGFSDIMAKDWGANALFLFINFINLYFALQTIKIVLNLMNSKLEKVV